LTVSCGFVNRDASQRRSERNIQGRMRGDDALSSTAALFLKQFVAKSADNFAMKRRSRGRRLKSLNFRTSRRVDRKERVHARFAIAHGPGERPRRLESAEFSKTYPGAICLGPWIIAVNSPADRT